VRRGDLFFFRAGSLSVAGKVNTVAYCPADDTSHCDCFAAEFGRACWHTRHVRMAWLVRMARNEIKHYSNEELGRAARRSSAAPISPQAGAVPFTPLRLPTARRDTTSRSAGHRCRRSSGLAARTPLNANPESQRDPRRRPGWRATGW